MSDEILEFRLQLTEEDAVLLLGAALDEQDHAGHFLISSGDDHAVWSRIVNELERSILDAMRHRRAAQKTG